MSAAALVLAVNAGAAEFTISPPPAEPTTSTFYLGAGDSVTVQEGGVINVTSGNGIEATSDGVTVNNAGSVTGASDLNGIHVFGNSTVTNSGSAEGGAYGIFGQGDGNTITNSGQAAGGSAGITALGNNNTIANSFLASSNTAGILAYGNDNTITNAATAVGGLYGIQTNGSGNTITNSGNSSGVISGIIAEGSGTTITNSGSATGELYGISAYGGDNTITNSGTASGTSDGGIAAFGDNNTIINSGRIISNAAAVRFDGTGNRLALLAGSNVQGLLEIAGSGGNTLVIGRHLSTALAYTGGDGVSIDASGQGFVSANGILAVVDQTLFSAEADMLNDLTRSLADVVDSRLASVHPGHSDPQPQLVTWATGIGSYRGNASNGINDGFGTTLGGFALGADGILSSGTQLGGFAGAGYTSLNTDAGTQEINSNSYYAGIYAGFTVSDAFLNLALAAGYADQSTRRDVLNNMVAGGVEHAEGNADGVFISPSATVGTDIDTGNVILTPSLRARYAALFMGNYDENGSAADLSVSARSVSLFDLRGQIAFAMAPVATNRGQFDAALRLGADAVFDISDEIDATLLDQSLTINPSDGETTVRGFGGLDLTYRMNGGARLILSGEAGYDTRDAITFTGSAGLAWAF